MATSDYTRDMISCDQDRLAKFAELQWLVDAGLASGISTRSPDEIRQLGRERLAAVKASGIKA